MWDFVHGGHGPLWHWERQMCCSPVGSICTLLVLQNEGGYTDGSWSTNKEERKGHSTAKTHKTTWHRHPYIFVRYLTKGTKIIMDGVAVLCLCACCVMTPCFFLFGASSHPYIPLHFEKMIFPLVSTIFNTLWQHCIFSRSDVHGYVVEITVESRS